MLKCSLKRKGLKKESLAKSEKIDRPANVVPWAGGCGCSCGFFALGQVLPQQVCGHSATDPPPVRLLGTTR